MRGFVVSMGLGVLVQCSIQTTSGSPGGPTGTTVWSAGPATVKGIAAFDDGLAQVSVDLPSSYGGGGARATVTGSVVAKGTTTPVTGTFDPSTGMFSVSGGGYSFNGTADSNGLQGFGNSPTSPGEFATMPSSPTVLCGTFEGSLTGFIGIVYSGDGRATAAFSVPSAQTRSTLQGTVSSGSISFSSPIVINGHSVTIRGTVGGGTAQGSWNDGPSSSGSWSVSACQ